MRREMGSDAVLVPDDPCCDNGLILYPVPPMTLFLMMWKFQFRAPMSRCRAPRRRVSSAKSGRGSPALREDNMINVRRPFAWSAFAAIVALMLVSSPSRHGPGMQESRPARHALLRREQRSRRRRADRSEEAEGPGHARLRLHAGRGPGGLSERVQAVHRISCPVHRQARRVLPGAVELSRDRSDALGPPARRGLLDRADRFRRQYGGRGSVRRQGHGERTARLSSALDRARRTAPTRSSPISRASASRIPRRRRTPGTLRRSSSIRPKG